MTKPFPNSFFAFNLFAVVHRIKSTRSQREKKKTLKRKWIRQLVAKSCNLKYLHQFVSFSCDGIQAWNSFFFGFLFTGFFFRFLFRFSAGLDPWWYVYFGQIFQLLLCKEKAGMKNAHTSTAQRRSEVFSIFIGRGVASP